MKSETEIVAAVISALQTAHIEMLTLLPRLSGQYQQNIKEACTRAKIALADAEEFYQRATTTKEGE